VETLALWSHAEVVDGAIVLRCRLFAKIHGFHQRREFITAAHALEDPTPGLELPADRYTEIGLRRAELRRYTTV